MSNYLLLKKMLYMVSLAAVGVVVGLIQIPWPLATFLRLDFSEVIVLVAFVVLGLKSTTVVIIIRTIVRLTIVGFLPQEIVGEVAAIFASFSIILGYYLAVKLLRIAEKPLICEVSVNNKLSLRQTVISTTFMTLSLTIVLLLANFLFISPMFLSLFGVGEGEAPLHLTVFTFIPGSEFTYWSFFLFVLVTFTPFNIAKGILVSLVFLMIKPRLKYLEL